MKIIYKFKGGQNPPYVGLVKINVMREDLA
jgi:hypothetical protein